MTNPLIFKPQPTILNEQLQRIHKHYHNYIQSIHIAHQNELKQLQQKVEALKSAYKKWQKKHEDIIPS